MHYLNLKYKLAYHQVLSVENCETGQEVNRLKVSLIPMKKLKVSRHGMAVGLHFCSHDLLNTYTGVAVKIIKPCFYFNLSGIEVSKTSVLDLNLNTPLSHNHSPVTTTLCPNLPQKNISPNKQHISYCSRCHGLLGRLPLTVLNRVNSPN